MTGHQPPVYLGDIIFGDIAEQRQAQYDALRHLAPRWHPDNPERAAELQAQLDGLYARPIEDSATQETIDRLIEQHADELERYGVGKPRPPIAPPLVSGRHLTVSDLVSPEAIERHTGLTVESLAKQRSRLLEDAHLEMLAADGQTTMNLLMAESVAAALNPQLRSAGAKLVLVRACIGCGCTDDEACDPPCSWATPDRCSACPEETQ